MTQAASEQERYDFIVVGAGAAGSVLAAELSASGAQVLVIESGGPDDAPTIANPSSWFYNVGGPLDYFEIQAWRSFKTTILSEEPLGLKWFYERENPNDQLVEWNQS